MGLCVPLNFCPAMPFSFLLFALSAILHCHWSQTIPVPFCRQCLTISYVCCHSDENPRFVGSVRCSLCWCTLYYSTDVLFSIMFNKLTIIVEFVQNKMNNKKYFSKWNIGMLRGEKVKLMILLKPASISIRL